MYEYRSPIELAVSNMRIEIERKQDEQVYRAVYDVGVKVDRDELMKALRYDREQYEKGYRDAKDEIVRCKDCKHWHEEIGWCAQHSSFIDSEGGFCHPWESANWKMFEEDDFCSYGKRK